jgi:sn-glycerol 3-phosphate transport system substrate-binding protein
MFNESQDDVVLEYQFQGSYEETAQKLTAALQARQAPDVSVLSDVWWFKFYLNNTLAPLNDFIAANEVDTADFVESLYNEGVRDGVSYWLPMARSTPLFYYNVEMFNEVGLEEAPEFWSNLVEVAPELVQKDGDTVTRTAFSHPTGASYIAWLFQCVIWQHGGRYSDPDFTIRINEPEGIEAGEFYRSTVADGWARLTADQETDFINGLSASMMASTGSMKQVTDGVGDRFEFRTAFLPKAEEFGCCTGGAGLGILATSPLEKQEAAFKFIEFASSTEGTTFWSQNTGYMPVRKSAIESEEMQAYFAENPNFQTAVEQLALTQPQDSARVFIPNGDQIIGAGLERIVVNLEDPQTVFDEVAQTLTAEAQPVLEALAALG